MFDFGPATAELTRVLTGVRDEQLDDATPCENMRVRDLIDHIEGFSFAFTYAATKTALPGEQAPQAEGARIGADWRERIPAKLDALAEAWRDPAAWDGMTKAGPLDMPAPAAACVALDEAVVHGWDLAIATGQAYRCADDLVGEALGFVSSFAGDNTDGIPGLFGPAVKVSGESAALEQLLGLTGRDPNWSP